MKRIRRRRRLRFGHKLAVGSLHEAVWRRYFTRRVWLRRSNCYGYWSPAEQEYFYWCAPHNCFYPVSYCPTGWYLY